MIKLKKLRRTQLDKNFERIEKITPYIRRPKQGWIKEIRESLGMSLQDLGSRMGVIKQRVERIQKDEVSGKVTLETMQKAAEALHCEFVYILIPKEGSLDKSLTQQAHKLADEILNSVDSTMKLENQATSTQSKKDLHKKLVHDLLEKLDRRFWK
jgi:predicted DNA-binding mobile mystery protein A